MNITKRKIKTVARVLNFGLGLIIFIYLGLNLKRQNYIIGDSAVEYGVSMHYDFKIIAASENSFYNFEGITREGKRVSFKIPRLWDLDGLYSVGDSVCKVAGDSVLHLITSNKRIDIPIREKEDFSFFFH